VTVSGTNFGKAAADYGAFRAGFPESIFDRLANFDVGLSGQVVVDLGTGTGTLARGFAQRGCDVIGVDPDPRMIAQAKELDRESEVSVAYVQAAAESTGLDSELANIITAGQCWHWFDRSRAIKEAIRVLKPGGKLVIAHFDWLPLAGNVVEATEKLIQQHNPAWHLGGGQGIYPQWLPGLNEAGIEGIKTFSYDLTVSYTPEAWRGRIRASAGVAALDEESAQNFDRDLANIISERYSSGELTVPHRVFAIVTGPIGI